MIAQLLSDRFTIMLGKYRKKITVMDESGILFSSDSSLPIAAEVIEVLSPENLRENACDRNHSYQ